MHRAEYWFKTALHAMTGLISRAICNTGVLLCIGSLCLILGRPGVVSVHAQPLVSLNLRDADVVKTLRDLAELGSLNVVISQDVRGTVTLRLEGVPVEDALEILLKTTGLVQVRKALSSVSFLVRPCYSIRNSWQNCVPWGLGNFAPRL